MTGMELKLRRVAARVKGVELAKAAGRSSAWVSTIEARAYVLPADVDRYVAALATLATNTTEAA